MSNFALYNANGNLIFDDTGYGVLAKSSSGDRVPGMTVNGRYSYLYVQIPSTADQIIAVAPGPSGRQMCSVVKNWDSVDTGGKVAAYSILNTRTDAHCRYLLLDTPSNLTSSADYGLRVFNSSGNAVFDSGLQYFIIRDAITLSYDELAYAAYYNNQTGGRNLLVKNHAYCANPYYIMDNLRWLTINYYYWAIGQYAVGTGCVGIQSLGSNTSIGFTNTLPINWGLTQDGLNRMLAAAGSTHFGPQTILVGELKNA